MKPDKIKKIEKMEKEIKFSIVLYIFLLGVATGVVISSIIFNVWI